MINIFYTRNDTGDNTVIQIGGNECIIDNQDIKMASIQDNDLELSVYNFGKIGIPLYDSTNNKVYYKYEDRKLTTEEKFLNLQFENANINYALMMGGLI